MENLFRADGSINMWEFCYRQGARATGLARLRRWRGRPFSEWWDAIWHDATSDRLWLISWGFPADPQAQAVRLVIENWRIPVWDAGKSWIVSLERWRAIRQNFSASDIQALERALSSWEARRAR